MRVVFMRLAGLLLIVLVPTAVVASPKTDSHVQFNREVVTKQATAMCACETASCGEKVMEEHLHWFAEHLAAPDDLRAAVDASETIKVQNENLSTCYALLASKSWAKSCQKRLDNAARSFARRAPRAYTPYRSLDFRPERGERKEHGHIAAIRIVPGRSWELRAVVGPVAELQGEFDIEDDALRDTWTAADSWRGLVSVKRSGPFLTVLSVNTERWGDHEPADHPLTKLFFAKLQEAADKCGR